MSKVGDLTIRPNFEWKINFRKLENLAVGEQVFSPVFSTYNYNLTNNKWKLLLYPKGNCKESENFVSLFLRKLDNNDTTVSYSITLLTQDNLVVRTFDTETVVFKGKNSEWGWPKFIEQSVLYHPIIQISKDKLKILCQFIVKDEKIETEKDIILKQNARRLKHVDGLEELLSNKDLSDITVKTGDKSFYLHKCILATNSTVFKAMFTHDMKEKNQGLLEIEDISYEVLQEFFRFMYTGKVNHVEKMVTELLIAAEKYNVTSLKDLCEETMCSMLTIKNAVNYLNLANQNNAERLKDYTIKWISLHLDELVEKSEFDDLKDSEILKQIMKKFVKTK